MIETRKITTEVEAGGISVAPWYDPGLGRPVIFSTIHGVGVNDVCIGGCIVAFNPSERTTVDPYLHLFVEGSISIARVIGPVGSARKVRLAHEVCVEVLRTLGAS